MQLLEVVLENVAWSRNRVSPLPILDRRAHGRLSDPVAGHPTGSADRVTRRGSCGQPRTDLRDRPGARLPHTTHHADAGTQTPVEILWVCGSEVPILDRRAHPAQRSGCRAPDGLRRSRDRAVTRVDSRAPTGMANTARLPDTTHRADAGARAPVGTWSWLPRTARQQLHPDDFARISLGHHRSQSTMLVRIAFELIHPSHDVGTARPTWVRSSELRPDLSDPRGRAAWPTLPIHVSALSEFTSARSPCNCGRSFSKVSRGTGIASRRCPSSTDERIPGSATRMPGTRRAPPIA
jgi:hypothetical protein